MSSHPFKRVCNDCSSTNIYLSDGMYKCNNCEFYGECRREVVLETRFEPISATSGNGRLCSIGQDLVQNVRALSLSDLLALSRFVYG